MTLRPEYSLGHSPYNPFLFASVGLAQSGAAGEDGGEVVTVLSALTRLKVDPWAEAAHLASLPPDAAAAALAATLARLPAVAWEQGDTESTARRLVTLLPAGGLADVPLMPGARAASAEPASGRSAPSKRSWLGWAVLFFVMLVLALYLKPDNSFEPAQPSGVTGQR